MMTNVGGITQPACCPAGPEWQGWPLPTVRCSCVRVWSDHDSLEAAGSHRLGTVIPRYRVRSSDRWNMLVDLMNHSTSSKTVYVEVTFTYRPSSESVKSLKPVWLDIDQCGDSEYSIPAGYSDTHRNWNVNVPGKVVAMLGHVHGHGIAVEATRNEKAQRRNRSAGQSRRWIPPTSTPY